MQLPKPQYIINYKNVGWVYDIPLASHNKAIDIWRRRWVKFFNVFMEEAMRIKMYGPRWNQLERITTDLYERVAALKWPDTVEVYKSHYYRPGDRFVLIPKQEDKNKG